MHANAQILHKKINIDTHVTSIRMDRKKTVTYFQVMQKQYHNPLINNWWNYTNTIKKEKRLEECTSILILNWLQILSMILLERDLEKLLHKKLHHESDRQKSIYIVTITVSGDKNIQKWKKHGNIGSRNRKAYTKYRENNIWETASWGFLQWLDMMQILLKWIIIIFVHAQSLREINGNGSS